MVASQKLEVLAIMHRLMQGFLYPYDMYCNLTDFLFKA